MSVPQSHFDALYAESPDPWGLTQRWYEQRKYALTLASLPHRRYASGYEPGCSIGVLTAALAGRCDLLLASDGSPAAVAQAQQRVSGLEQVRVEQRRLPAQWPRGSFDLVVLSELLYFLDQPDLASVIDLAVGSLDPGGTLVAVHWRHVGADHPSSADKVHALLAAQCSAAGLGRLVEHREDDFLLDVHVRPRTGESAPASVAVREGLR